MGNPVSCETSLFPTVVPGPALTGWTDVLSRACWRLGLGQISFSVSAPVEQNRVYPLSSVSCLEICTNCLSWMDLHRVAVSDSCRSVRG